MIEPCSLTACDSRLIGALPLRHVLRGACGIAEGHHLHPRVPCEELLALVKRLAVGIDAFNLPESFHSFRFRGQGKQVMRDAQGYLAGNNERMAREQIIADRKS